MGIQLDRLRYEVFRNLFYSPMDTEFLSPAVATAPTVYGMRRYAVIQNAMRLLKLQQHLPFTVCAEGCEAAEEQSDDEARTSQVPERSEGKTKMMGK